MEKLTIEHVSYQYPAAAGALCCGTSAENFSPGR